MVKSSSKAHGYVISLDHIFFLNQSNAKQGCIFLDLSSELLDDITTHAAIHLCGRRKANFFICCGANMKTCSEHHMGFAVSLVKCLCVCV